MSFGFSGKSGPGFAETEQAIQYAASKNVLMFAAASKSGATLGRAWPARHSHVICVHSTDTNGNRSSFSLKATADALNLATVGEYVESSWPEKLFADTMDGKPPLTTFKLGTSFAIPIMVGIATMLMIYVRIHLHESSEAIKRQQQMQKLLKFVSRKADAAMRNQYYFVDLSLYNDSLYGKQREFIDASIQDVLTS